jgi:hypothetical protein
MSERVYQRDASFSNFPSTSGRKKWHRKRPDDSWTAVCSPRILLDDTFSDDSDNVHPSRLCARCMRAVSQSDA